MEKIEILIAPRKENDPMSFVLKNFQLSESEINSIIYSDFKTGIKEIDEHKIYLRTKAQAFFDKDDSKVRFKEHKYRPSLQNIDKLDSLNSSIYTVACSRKNMVDYEKCLELIKMMPKNSRRRVLNFTDPLLDSYWSETMDLHAPDISCTSFIQYLENRVNIVMRASCILNELICDILLDYKFFIFPIYGEKPVDVAFFSTTAQNVDVFYKTMQALTLFYPRGENETI